jgi:hypothetical protein
MKVGIYWRFGRVDSMEISVDVSHIDIPHPIDRPDAKISDEAPSINHHPRDYCTTFDRVGFYNGNAVYVERCAAKYNAILIEDCNGKVVIECQNPTQCGGCECGSWSEASSTCERYHRHDTDSDCGNRFVVYRLLCDITRGLKPRYKKESMR